MSEESKKNIFKKPIFVVGISILLVVLLIIILVIISMATNPKGKYESALKQKLKQDHCKLTKKSREYLSLYAKKLQIGNNSRMLIDSKIESSFCSAANHQQSKSGMSNNNASNNLSGAKANINLGDMLVTQGRYNKAKKEFKRAIKDDSNYYLGYFDLASVYIKKGFYDKAITTAKNGIKNSNSKNPYLYYDIAVAYSRKNDLGIALDNFKKSVKLGFNNVEALEKDSGLNNLRVKEKSEFCKILHNNKIFIKFCQ
jgi:Putative Zn-dependent protease, contains TPR repeats